MIGNTWNMSKYTGEKYIFQSSAANGFSNKSDYLIEVEHVLQFIIATPPQVDTITYLNYGSCFTYIHIHVRATHLAMF